MTKFNKKIFFIFALLIFSSMLTGCFDALTSMLGDQIPEAPEDKEILITGTDGLQVEFKATSFPDEMLAGETYTATISLNNKGNHDVTNGILNILVNPDIFSTNSEQRYQSINLEGYSEYRLGERDEMYFDVTAIDLAGDEEFIRDDVTIVSCYNYETVIDEDFCINPRELEDNTCAMREKRFSEGQGSPVMIASIEPSIINHKDYYEIVFRIQVENKGQGRVLKYGALNKYCINNGVDLVADDLGTLTINDIQISTFGPGDITCSPDPFSLPFTDGSLSIDPSSNNKQLTCKINHQFTDFSATTYKLRLSLKYGYVQEISKEVKVTAFN